VLVREVFLSCSKRSEEKDSPKPPTTMLLQGTRGGVKTGTCEDENGNSLCKREVGIYCSAKQYPDGSVNYFRLTRDGIAVLRHVGCPLFEAREQRDREESMKRIRLPEEKR
jgi:hypothetical protein